MRASWGVFAFFGALLTGCAIHPQPQDYSGVTTADIVRQIRCETRDAVRSSIVEFLTDNENYRQRLVDDRSRKVGLNLYESHDYKDFRIDQLSGGAKSVVSLILATGIADNYNLQMTETNSNDASLDVFGGSHGTGHFLGLGSKLDLKRQNTRIFTTTDTFSNLYYKLPDEFCWGHVKNKNILYPITGEIGLQPVIQTFVKLAITDSLAGDATGSFKGPGGPAQMAEQLQFTTTLNLSANPHVVFAPAGLSYHVIDASVTVEANRVDLHQLTIGLYVPKGTPISAIRGGVYTATGAPEASPFGVLASAPVTSDAERGALAVVNQALTLKLFQNSIQVVAP